MQKLRPLIVFLFLFLSASAYSQLEHGARLFTNFTDNGERISFRDAEQKIKSSPAAYPVFLKGKKFRTIETFTLASALALEVYALANGFEDNDGTGIQLTALGLTGASLVFEILKNKRFQQATSIYNRENGLSGISINPSISRHGIGVQFRF